MFKRHLSGGDPFDAASLRQARSLLNGAGLLGSGSGGVVGTSLLASLNSINLQSHFMGSSLEAGISASSNPLLELFLKQSLNNNSNQMPTMDLLLARQKLLLGQNGSSMLSQAGNLSTLAKAAHSMENTPTTVSQAIRKRIRTPPRDQETKTSSNKRRRKNHVSAGWIPSCASSNESATFRLPQSGGEGGNPLEGHPLKTFRARWADLEKKAFSLKSVNSESEKGEFIREMFARSLRNNCTPSGCHKKNG